MIDYVDPTIQAVRRAFLDFCADRRIEFENESKEYFDQFCRTHNYRERWPAESLKLAITEFKVRNAELKRLLSNAIKAGWKPSPALGVQAAAQRCSSADNYDENPSTDLRDFILGAFDRVGRPMSYDEERHQRRMLGNVFVRGMRTLVHEIETQATAKYGSYRVVDYNDEFKSRVLKALYEHFLASHEHLFAVGLLHEMGIEADPTNARMINRAFRFWLGEGAIKAVESTPIEGDSVIAVLDVTGKGEQIVEGRGLSPAPIQQTFNIAGNVGVAGTMTGGNITQNIGGSFTDLAEALERLRAELRASDDPLAGAIEATAEKGAILAREAQPDRGAIQRSLTGLFQLVQTISAVPQAWTFIAAEALKLGFNVPGPPSLS